MQPRAFPFRWKKGGGGGHGKAWTELACAAVGGSRSTSFAGHARAGFWLVLTDAVHAPRRTSRTAGGSWFISDDSEPQRPIHEFYCSSLQCFPTMEAAGREGKSERASCGGARSGGGANAMQSKPNKKQVMIQSHDGSLKCLCILIDAAMIQRPTMQGAQLILDLAQHYLIRKM